LLDLGDSLKKLKFQGSIIVPRKIKIDEKPIYLILFMPSLMVINKSGWNFMMRSQATTPSTPL
jgi:hypothetical protein